MSPDITKLVFQWGGIEKKKKVNGKNKIISNCDVTERKVLQQNGLT